ncbi:MULTISPECIES: MDR family MFS transporter [Bacillus]|uniref:MDR family MFS transporter n=1 Tax=Bacillus TaxID=1386 RepID=UPI0002EDD0AC|nr:MULTISPECIES: MFS transporter [Bacillus]
MLLNDLPQNLKVRLITSFFNQIASSAVLPFMALYFSQEMNKIWAGVFLIGSVVVNFFSNLIGGYISDRFQRRKIILITSIFNAVSYLLMTISLFPKNNSIFLFAISYLVLMITSGLGRPAMQAMILDSTTPENRKRVYAIDYWLVNLSMTIGTSLGGLLYMNHKKELFIILTITAILTAFSYQIWLLDSGNAKLGKRQINVFLDLIHNYKIALKNKLFIRITLGYMFIVSVELSLDNYISVRLNDTFQTVHIYGMEIEGVHMFSILNIENMILVVGLTFFVSHLTNRFSNRKALMIGLILYGIGYVILTSSNSMFLLLLFGLIATLGELIYSPIYFTEQAQLIPENNRGSYSAFSSVAYNGADLIARSSLIIGAFLPPIFMSIYLGFIILLGIILIHSSIASIPKQKS